MNRWKPAVFLACAVAEVALAVWTDEAQHWVFASVLVGLAAWRWPSAGDLVRPLTAKQLACDHLPLPNNGTCIRCGLSTRAALTRKGT